MKVKCEYCESFIDDSEDMCPNCGAVNENMKRVANGVPTTIQELKDFCVDHNLPISKMRFYIGENYKLPKAYGIYQDETSGEFIVYKNKSDGSRAIRYQGIDEAYAVNEIYLKLQTEIQKQKNHQAAMENARRNSSNYATNNRNYSNTASSSNYSNNRNNRNSGKKSLGMKIFIIIFVIMFGSSILEFLIFGIFGAVSMFSGGSSSSDSYYEYDSGYYSDDYDYDYDNDNDYDYDYDDDYDYSYDDDWDSDWDSDYDWDSGSDWDSSYSDWDSDW